MIEKPILFSGPMVRAILEGHKTQTRRVVKPQLPKVRGDYYFDAYNGGPNWNFWTMDGRMVNSVQGDKKNSCQWTCPYGKPGDRLWVRETWGWVGDHHHEDHRSIYWKADRYDWRKTQKWRPSIFMPRWAYRIMLEVTDVRVQRVQEISEEDAKAEGVDRDKYGVTFYAPGVMYTNVYGDHCEGVKPYKRATEAFRDLWDSVNAKRGFGWDVNPVVWVVGFKRVV